MFNYVLKCHGIGAQAFLQGQLTCNVNILKENQEQLTACCNLQGRVIFTAVVIMQNTQCFSLKVPESMKMIVMDHLNKYARFSKCFIEDNQPQTDSSSLLTDKKGLILNGIPIIYPETSELFIAQRLNLHLIEGAISFKKGCYLGQEIISRLHFKGKLKHHMYLGEISNAHSLKLNDEIKDSVDDVTGHVVDFHVDDNRVIFLFINTIENKTPKISHDQTVTLLTLPYSYKDEIS